MLIYLFALVGGLIVFVLGEVGVWWVVGIWCSCVVKMGLWVGGGWCWVVGFCVWVWVVCLVLFWVFVL